MKSAEVHLVCFLIEELLNDVSVTNTMQGRGGRRGKRKRKRGIGKGV